MIQMPRSIESVQKKLDTQVIKLSQTKECKVIREIRFGQLQQILEKKT
jgi:hypothetical protein